MKHIYILLFIVTTFSLAGQGTVILDAYEGKYLSLTASEIEVAVDNQIAITKTKQTFVNLTGETGKIKYGFPLNKDANPVNLRWNINNIWDEAHIDAQEQNEDLPGDGSTNTIDTELLNYLTETPLFFDIPDSIGVDSTIVVEMVYVELLPYFLGEVTYQFPSSFNITETSTINFSFDFNMNSEREILTINHNLLNATLNTQTYQAALSLQSTVSNVNKIELSYQLLSDDLGLIALSTFSEIDNPNCDDYGDGFTTLIIEPEMNENVEIIEKNFIVVIDESGSMGTEKMEQAKQAASFMINNLNDGDSFNVISFDSDYQLLFSQLQVNDQSNQNQALQFINDIASGGGTNITSALVTAINQFEATDPLKANIILFFTDGNGSDSASSTLQAVQNTVNNLNTSIFMYTFGIGQSVNHYLLAMLAENFNGNYQQLDATDFELTLTNSFLAINNPVLLNTEISFNPNVITQVYPANKPNLYMGQQLIVSGRYNNPQQVEMTLTGNAFNLPVTHTFTLNLSDSADVSKSILPKIWAKQKIESIAFDLALTQNQNVDSLETEIDSLSTCFQIVNVNYSSFQPYIDNGGGFLVETEEIEHDLSSDEFNLTISSNANNSTLKINITTNSNIGQLSKIKVFDIAGRLITSNQSIIQSSNHPVNIQLPNIINSGIYLISVQINNQVKTIKIVL